MLILLIDERPEEVTDIKEAIHGDNVEVIYSTFDELRAPQESIRDGDRACKASREHKKDVVILPDKVSPV